MATAAQIQDALSRATAANDTAAVADLSARLGEVQGNAYMKDDGMAWMNNYNAADNVGPMEAGLIGAGRTVDKFVTGVGDLFAGDEQQAATARGQANNDREYAKLQERHPYATTAGEIAGYIPSMMVPGGMAAQTAVGGLTGAAMYNTPEERAKQGAIDAGLNAAPYGIGKVLKKAMAAGSRLAKRADDLNWNLTPGEALDSAGLKRMEASLESFPPTAGPMRGRKAGRQESMNKVALNAIGEGGNDFADDALLAARARVGQVFEETIKPKTFQIDNTFLNQLGETEGIAKQGLLGGGDTGKIVDRILEAASKGDGAVSGAELQQWRTTLGTAAQKAAKSDNATQEYTNALKGMGRAIDDLIERTLKPEELKRWAQARGQWRAIKQLEKSKAIDEVGNVRGRKLANNLSNADVPGYYRGGNKSDLYDAARLSRAYAPMADSGTASRMSIPMMAATAATSPVSVPMMGAANIGARMYANPEKSARLLSGVARGATTSSPPAQPPNNNNYARTKEYYQRQMAQILRGGR